MWMVCALTASDSMSNKSVAVTSQNMYLTPVKTLHIVEKTHIRVVHLTNYECKQTSK